MSPERPPAPRDAPADHELTEKELLILRDRVAQMQKRCLQEFMELRRGYPELIPAEEVADLVGVQSERWRHLFADLIGLPKDR